MGATEVGGHSTPSIESAVLGGAVGAGVTGLVLWLMEPKEREKVTDYQQWLSDAAPDHLFVDGNASRVRGMLRSAEFNYSAQDTSDLNLYNRVFPGSPRLNDIATEMLRRQASNRTLAFTVIETYPELPISSQAKFRLIDEEPSLSGLIDLVRRFPDQRQRIEALAAKAVGDLAQLKAFRAEFPNSLIPIDDSVIARKIQHGDFIEFARLNPRVTRSAQEVLLSRWEWKSWGINYDGLKTLQDADLLWEAFIREQRQIPLCAVAARDNPRFAALADSIAYSIAIKGQTDCEYLNAFPNGRYREAVYKSLLSCPSVDECAKRSRACEGVVHRELSDRIAQMVTDIDEGRTFFGVAHGEASPEATARVTKLMHTTIESYLRFVEKGMKRLNVYLGRLQGGDNGVRNDMYELENEMLPYQKVLVRSEAYMTPAQSVRWKSWADDHFRYLVRMKAYSPRDPYYD